ncbi:hypothetical protein Pyn_17262 [Prunus yedoensis var. nudiflora]|uniref:Uncharacterized protein n=1 Tax=Prunus yedoensis var. nudiflora TaxID=2094558 RepID=A0A314UGS6_PRUYE|nr:hypothetical protein Pyn_17262 [Prunus yedoensis var. nudiflora]
MEGERGSKEQSAKAGEMGKMGKQSAKIAGFESEEACSLKVVGCWVEEALFVVAGFCSSPRNPNGFFPI